MALFFHPSFEGIMIAILNRMHAGMEGSLDILRFVIYEENVCRRSIEPLSGGFIDGFFGFGQAELIGPDAVIKAADPLELLQQALGHGIPDVGEDSGANAGALKPLCPIEQGYSAGSIRRYPLRPDVRSVRR